MFYYVSLGVPAGLTWLLPGARPSCIHLGGKKHTFIPGKDVECGKHIHFSELQSFRLDLAVKSSHFDDQNNVATATMVRVSCQ